MRKAKKIIKITSYFLILILGLASISLAHTDEISIEKQLGYTNYIIYDHTYSWRSKLEFPLDTELIVIKRDVNPFSLFVKFNINKENQDLFKDSDWLYNNPYPDIYAEAKSRMNTIILEGKFRIQEGKIFNINLGYEYQYYDFVIYDPNIIYRNSNNSEYIDGDVLEYNITYNIPFVELVSSFDYEELNLLAAIKFSPLVDVDDYDYHILRDKTTESNTGGYGFEYRLNISYNINNNLSFNMGYQKQNIETTGSHKQLFSDDTVVTGITAEINKYSENYSIGVKYSF